MNFKIENTEVYGLNKSVKASGNPMRTVFDRGEVTEKDLARAKSLGTAQNGQGHDNYLKGIIVQMDVTAPQYWWKQAQRYHWFDFVSSQSTMHSLMKFKISEQCVDETNKEVIKILEGLVDEWNALEDPVAKSEKWREIVASLPAGFCLGATMTTNYQQLKTMYIQRKNHKLKEWHEFCDWCESLPQFLELTGADKFVI
ncbi:MAG: hypothetical protein LUC16_02570 [Coprobacillus sp.]|nr:hypothetical protein [Coprobacillus sp.]